MLTRLERSKENPSPKVDIEFVRIDGKGKVYTISAVWDPELKSWLQWGAPPEILKENVETVQRYYYSKNSFDFGRLVNEIRRSV